MVKNIYGALPRLTSQFCLTYSFKPAAEDVVLFLNYSKQTVVFLAKHC